MQVLIRVPLVSRAYSHLRRAALIELLDTSFSGLATVITATHHTTFHLEERHDKAEALPEGISGSSSSFSTTAVLIVVFRRMSQLTFTVEEFWLPILDALNLALTNAC